MCGVGIHLTALSTSKPKANPLAFGFQNAWNTGLGSCRGPYIAIVNDYAWLAEEFVQSVIGFYEDVREDLSPVGERRLVHAHAHTHTHTHTHTYTRAHTQTHTHARTHTHTHTRTHTHTHTQ